jgi:hypothetical protein
MDAAPAAAGRLAPILTRAALYTLLLAAICRVIQGNNLSVQLFRGQDLGVLVLAAGILLLLPLVKYAPSMPRLRMSPASLVAAAAVLALLVAWAGTWLVFGGYALTRDEIAADFDAAFLARGMLIAPVPAEWQSWVPALMPQFMLPMPASVGWLSAYLPGNSALRAIGIATIGADWVNPILAALAILALYRVGRRLWPESPRLPLMPLLLLASSAQFLTMAMTAYAMTAHLAFNLIWLACFLRRDRRGDVGALAAGFVATGLHQVLFHPLFVFPFIVSMWFSGERRRALAYVGAYAAIGLFWICYWQIALAGLGGGHATPGPGGVGYLVERVRLLLVSINGSAFTLMALNLARMLAWQNLLLVPLALLAWPAIRRGQGIARPLAAGIALTFVTMLILIPWQGHGWGYRYLHGFLGSFALLAAYGWQSLAGTPDQGRRLGVLVLGSAISLAVLLPIHLIQARDFVVPYRRAYAAIRAAPVDVVLVDGTGLLYAEDLVRNAPDLSNRPRVMDMMALTGPGMVRLCRRYRVARFTAAEGRAWGIGASGAPLDWPPSTTREHLLDRLKCGVRVPTP